MTRYNYLRATIRGHNKQLIFFHQSVFVDQLILNAIHRLHFLISVHKLSQGDLIYLIIDQRSIAYFEILIACLLGGILIYPVNDQLEFNNFRIKSIKHPTHFIKVSEIGLHSNNNLPDCCYIADEHIPFLIVNSSGTTGKKKYIVHSAYTLFQAAVVFTKHYDAKPYATYYHCWPLNYYAGIFNLFVCPLVSGGNIALHPELNASSIHEFWLNFLKIQPSIMYLSPTMINLVLKTASIYCKEKNPFENCHVISTSTVLYPEIATRFKEKFQNEIFSCYGITEMGGSFTFGQSLTKNFTVGPIMPEIDCKFVNQMIYIKSPYSALGYLSDEGDITQIPTDESGFYSTGDIGYLDQRDLILIGRESDCIQKGGMGLSLTDIENCVLSLDGIFECCAVAKKDYFWGENYDLFITLDNSHTNQPTVVIEKTKKHIHQNMPSRCWPDQIIVIDELPKTSSGKTIKRLIFSDIERISNEKNITV